jgi:demethylmenaquinone methyltransferase / 2-methoxy-6-polyprenyl-1,4-benzoquinol methylase
LKGALVNESAGNQVAKKLFRGIAPKYDFWAMPLSIMQYRHWHALLLAALKPNAGEKVLDVSTGTGAVAIDLARRGCLVTGLDLSMSMLATASRRVREQGLACAIDLVRGRAEDLPFPDSSFDAVSFTFLLRYTESTTRPVEEIIRVLKPGGRVATLEFGVPRSPAMRHLWNIYAFYALPLLSRFAPGGWETVGDFLGPNISTFIAAHPISSLVSEWRSLGLSDVRAYEISAGGAFVISAKKAGA